MSTVEAILLFDAAACSVDFIVYNDPLNLADFAASIVRVLPMPLS